ncbi:hypothetical protein [Streptomyces sp. FxanaA7]|uniref:hypothetical protein n=1 Tax=Streptomyces sp. FxanaA7 TaxID=1265492 RepID=UPI0005F04177|nr:hypothetical protein [Streptomyces sp. FxanaA7]
MPLVVGHGDVDVLRLTRIVGRKGQQLQGFQLGKRHRQVPVQKGESLVRVAAAARARRRTSADDLPTGRLG